MELLAKTPSATEAKSVTSLLDLTSSADVTEDRFLEALNMPIADIEMKFLKISRTKRDRLAKVLGADDSEPATLIRKLKQLRNIEDTSVLAATKEKSDDSSSNSDDDDFTDAKSGDSNNGSDDDDFTDAISRKPTDGELSDAETVVPDGTGAPKQAEPVKKLEYNEWQTLVKGMYTKKMYGTTTKAQKAKAAAWKQYLTS